MKTTSKAQPKATLPKKTTTTKGVISKKTALQRLKSKLTKSKTQALTSRLNADADAAVNDILVASNAIKLASAPGISAFTKVDLDKSLSRDVETTRKAKATENDLTSQLEMISGFTL